MNRSLSISRKEFVADALIILLCIGMLLALDSQRSYVFFRDYAITFEGAYRLFLGQLPYRDFGMPVGPVSLLIPSVFFRAFGADWEVFHVSQLFQNGVLLLLIWGVLHRLQVRPLTKRLSLLSYTLFSLSLLSHPWYNISGHMLMAATLLLGLGTSWTSVIAAGFMAGLGILSKQDFGALGLLMCSVVIAHKALFTDAVPGADTPVYHTGNLGRAMLRVLLFWLLAAAVTGLCALVTDPVQFAYWFNLGQPPHQPRGLTLHDLLGNSFGTLGLLAAGIGLWKNNLPMLICAMVITSASITRTTSGLHFTHYYFVAFVPVLIDELIRMKVRFKPLLLVLLLYTSYRVMIRPAHDLYRVVDSISAGQPEHFFFDRRMLTGSTAPFPDDLASFSPQLQAPDDTIDALRALLAELRTRSNLHGGTQDLILNLSELTPIYTAAGAVPPTGFPLWFHEKITVFDKEAEQLRRELTGTRFEAILVQGTALPSLHLELLDLLDRNPGYRKFRTVRATPATATGPCHGQCDEYIHIYLKQSTETRR